MLINYGNWLWLTLESLNFTINSTHSTHSRGLVGRVILLFTIQNGSKLHSRQDDYQDWKSSKTVKVSFVKLSVFCSQIILKLYMKYELWGNTLFQINFGFIDSILTQFKNQNLKFESSWIIYFYKYLLKILRRTKKIVNKCGMSGHDARTTIRHHLQRRRQK